MYNKNITFSAFNFYVLVKTNFSRQVNMKLGGRYDCIVLSLIFETFTLSSSSFISTSSQKTTKKIKMYFFPFEMSLKL